MEFCYLVRRDVIDDHTLASIDEALARFHRERVIFETQGVCPDGISLPRQHSLTHYRHLIQLFGAPNGLCSSITESKHIKAVKEPYRRSSKHNALGQMLMTNQRLDKLAAIRIAFESLKMLDGPLSGLLARLQAFHIHERSDSGNTTEDLEEDEDFDEEAVEGEQIEAEVVLAKTPGAHTAMPNICTLTALIFLVRGLPRDLATMAEALGHPELPELIRRFLYDQFHPFGELNGDTVDLSLCPPAPERIKVFPSAVATFYAPSDHSGIRGLKRERIRSVSSWRGGPARRDCVFISGDDDLPGFRGLHAARVLLFFSIKLSKHVTIPCALVNWFSPVGDEPCADTGMWVVEPDMGEDGERIKGVVHLDAVVRGAHLLGVAGEEFLPTDFDYTDTLDAFEAFYVNKYADHHSHTIAF